MRAFHLPHQLVCIAESTLKKPNRNKPCWYETPQVTWFHVYGFRLPKQIASYDLKARCKMFRNMNRNTTMNFPLTLTCLRVGIELVGVWVYVNIWRAVVKKQCTQFSKQNNANLFSLSWKQKKKRICEKKKKNNIYSEICGVTFLVVFIIHRGRAIEISTIKIVTAATKDDGVCLCSHNAGINAIGVCWKRNQILAS